MNQALYTIKNITYILYSKNILFMKVYIETHGCKLNIADSQRIADQLLEQGMKISDNILDTDVYLLNTCTVTQSADKKARNKLRNIRKKNPNVHIVATGCYVERNMKEVTDLGIADTVVGNFSKENLSTIINNKFSKKITDKQDVSINNLLLGRTRASIAIQKGCNQICSYCIVPKVRGREKSISKTVIISRIKKLEKFGCKEVVLTGTQLGTYGYDLTDHSLHSLLKQILDETNIERIRLSSVQPHEFSDQLFELWNHKKYRLRLCPHFHIPLQSGSDKILKSMRRKYTTETFLSVVEKIKKNINNSTITTDIIVGFPGENSEDHNLTKTLLLNSLIKEIHVFPYSKRPGTSAYYLKDQIHSSLITIRAKEIRRISEKLKLQQLEEMIDTEQEVLWEKNKPLSGYTTNYSYFVNSQSNTIYNKNDLSKVIIKSVDKNFNLIGKIIG